MFEPQPLGNERLWLPLLALLAVSLSLHLLGNNVILFSSYKGLIFSFHDAWRVRISTTTQYNSIFVIIEHTEMLAFPSSEAHVMQSVSMPIGLRLLQWFS